MITPSSLGSSSPTSNTNPSKPSLSVSLATQLGLSSLSNVNHLESKGEPASDPLYLSTPHFNETSRNSTHAWMLERNQWLIPSIPDLEDLRQRIKDKLVRGGGECILVVGASEDGSSLQFSQEEYGTALKQLTDITSQLNAVATPLCPKTKYHFTVQTLETLSGELATPSEAKDVDGVERTGVETYFLIRQTLDVEQLMEVRVAVCGNVDSGKSSLLGVLTKNVLDNGRGRARVALFRHPHEVDSGRTSSVGTEIMGFDPTGTQVGVVYNPITEGVEGPAPKGQSLPLEKSGKVTWDHIAMHSSKLITFFDLAGHEKYMKTTVYGLCGASPDFSILIIGANMGIVGMTREHLGLSLALNVPVMIVITKIDLCPEPVLHQTVTQLLKILKSKGCRKLPFFIRNHEDVVKVASLFVSERICPIFLVSNVTGQGLPCLRKFLNLLPLMSRYDLYKPAEYVITENFSIPGVGTVVSGIMMSGSVHVGETLYLGPDVHGLYVPTQVKSIQIKRVPVPSVSAGHTATFALKKIKRAMLRKGMVLLAKEAEMTACREFEAEVLVLSHSTTILPKYQATLHCQNVRQTATVIGISGHSLLRTGDKALVHFRFLSHPEHLKCGTRILFREGRTKCIGNVFRTIPLPRKESSLAERDLSTTTTYPVFDISAKARKTLRKKLTNSDMVSRDESKFLTTNAVSV